MNGFDDDNFTTVIRKIMLIVKLVFIADYLKIFIIKFAIYIDVLTLNLDSSQNMKI